MTAPRPTLVRRLAATTALATALALAPIPARALNGHFIHGVGARNSSLGGAGVALPTDALSALALNPALLTGLDGYQVQSSIELLAGSPEVESSVATPFGTFSGVTEDDTGLLPIPAFGWSHHRAGSRLAYGMGTLAMAGFLTDYPQDPRNPILAPQPQGFGRVSSEYQYLRIPLALAYRVSDRLSLGGALTLGYARLGASPAAFAAPDCSSPADCVYPAANAEGAYGWGAQVGLHYRASPAWSFGASYSSEQSFEDFEFNSEVANPRLPSAGTARSFEFAVDVPAQAVVGVAWRPNERLAVALDGKWIGYDGVAGLGTFGFNPDGSIRGFGWDDIVVAALGVEYAPGERWSLRAGYNLAESPIVPERALLSLPAPATFEDHVTLGLGARVTEALVLDLAYYRGFENDVSGPLLGPAGPVPGTEVTQRNSSDSVVSTFSFTF
ncbi:MAG TPA: outer membrane protein transport protein [Thermoanaerobaculia bacterium]|nr:outer membrane protein transport protein [Thermoanaerobaculia bacterium]